MKTYTEVISYYARAAANEYMNGSNEYLGGVDYEMIAFIYGVDYKVVIADLKQAINSVING